MSNKVPDDFKLPVPPVKSADPKSKRRVSGEDAGTQALSEALSSSFRILKILMAVLVLVFIASGVFTVNPNEEAVILRFGKATSSETLKPGLHWAFPFPIDEIVRVPVRQSHTARSTAGWYYNTPENEALGIEPPAMDFLRPGIDGYALTADGNIIHVRVTIAYQISNALDYTFHYSSTPDILVNILNNAIYYAAGRFPADEALYKNKIAFNEAVERRIEESIIRHNLGVSVENIEVNVKAPLYVAEAFSAVQAAEQDRSRTISEAEGYLNQVKNKAIGEGQSVVSGGIAASNRVVRAVSADANYFMAQLPNYENNPGLFVSRLVTERMQRVFTNAQDTIFIPGKIDGSTRELRIQLSREPLMPKSANN